MKNIVAAALIVGGLSACGEMPEENVEPTGPAVEVDSVSLAQAYADNEVAAQQQYGNSPLLVSGEVRSIELDMMDEPVVMLPGTDDFTSVHVSFAGDASEVVAQLSKGDGLTVRCAGVAEMMGSPMLSECVPQ